MSEHCKSPVSMDDLHGDVPVAQITLTLNRSGLESLACECYRLAWRAGHLPLSMAEREQSRV